MKRWRVFLVLAFGMTTFLIVGTRRAPELSCQTTIAPTALTGEYDADERAAFFENRWFSLLGR